MAETIGALVSKLAAEVEFRLLVVFRHGSDRPRVFFWGRAGSSFAFVRLRLVAERAREGVTSIAGVSCGGSDGRDLVRVRARSIVICKCKR